MISKLNPYPEYKDSGVPWLGAVPKHWAVQPVFTCYLPRQVKNIGMKENKVLSLSYGRIVVKSPDKLHGLVPESFETYQIADKDDIIIRPTDLQNDHNSLRVGSVKERGIITSAYLCLRTKESLSSSYGYQFLNVWDLTKAIYSYGSGLRQNLDFAHFKRMPVSVPPSDEQEIIVRYLQVMNRYINLFISKRRRLIELLGEQKQGIINQYVTGKIDPRTGKPYSRYKPSGVDWLGDVPAHWEVRRLRNIVELRVSNVDKHSKEEELPVRLCNYTDVYKNREIKTGMAFMVATATPDEITAFCLQIDDVLITKDSEDWKDIGVPSLVTSTSDDLVCGYHLAILRPKKSSIIGSYLACSMGSRPVVLQMNVSANGVTRYGLSHNAIKNIILPVPPIDEQSSIAKFISKATEKLNETINNANSEIDLLREYRTRLIADVVTGKVDVRGVELPEAEADEEALLDDAAEEMAGDEIDNETNQDEGASNHDD